MAELAAEQLMAAFRVMFADGLVVAVLMLLIGRYMKNWPTRYVSGAVFAGILCSFLEKPPDSYADYLLAGLLWVAAGHIAVIARRLLRKNGGQR